ncbi:MAG: CopG family transcriptional regulator [Anaerolineales bacterium]
MSEYMVRKQIYIPKQQDALLKRLAKQRGVSEAEVIRRALTREVEAPAPVQDAQKALAKMSAFAEERKTKFAGQGEPFRWNRDELYDERESRWFKPGAEQ